MAQHLTLEGVKAAARDYYERGLLTAQHPEPDKRVCVYLGSGGRRCAIGAALDDDLVMEATGTVKGLEYHHGVTFDSDKALCDISDIQMAHDSWCTEDEEYRKDAEAKFVELIA